MNEKVEKTALPPYVAYKSFINFINGLRETGLPTQIDRSVMPGMAGSQQSAMLKSLTFMRLLDEHSRPTTLMKQLVEADEDKRQSVIKSILEGAYDFLFKDDHFHLDKASGNQMADKFRNQDVSGSTVTKCVGFFLAAAKDAGIKVSPHIRPPQPQGVKRSARKKGKDTVDDFDEPDDHDDGSRADDGLHPFIKGLLDKLPEPETEWAIQARVKWLQTASNIFDLMYKAPSDDSLKIIEVKLTNL